MNRSSLPSRTTYPNYDGHRPDQSLTLHIRHDSPGADGEANWLPAPAGQFKIALRLYQPKQQVVDGTWEPPAVTNVG
jgi:hypothetical protein